MLESHFRVHARPSVPSSLRIYEAHVGIGSQEKRIASYNEFAGGNNLPFMLQVQQYTLILLESFIIFPEDYPIVVEFWNVVEYDPA